MASAAHDVETEEEFNEWLEKAGDKLVVVDFWAPWCGPCKMIGPEFKRLSEDVELQRSVIFLKADVDKLSDLAEEVGIECMPTFVFFKNKKKIDDMAGANTSLLKEYLEKYK